MFVIVRASVRKCACACARVCLYINALTDFLALAFRRQEGVQKTQMRDRTRAQLCQRGLVSDLPSREIPGVGIGRSASSLLLSQSFSCAHTTFPTVHKTHDFLKSFIKHTILIEVVLTQLFDSFPALFPKDSEGFRLGFLWAIMSSSPSQHIHPCFNSVLTQFSPDGGWPAHEGSQYRQCITSQRRFFSTSNGFEFLQFVRTFARLLHIVESTNVRWIDVSIR